MKGNCLPAAWFPLFFLNQVCSPASLLFALYRSFACRTDSSKTAARIAGLCARASFYDSAMLRHACLHWGERLLSRQKLLDRMRKYPLRLSTLNWAEWFGPCFFFFPARRNRSEDMGFSSRVSSAIRLDYICISMNANPSAPCCWCLVTTSAMRTHLNDQISCRCHIIWGPYGVRLQKILCNVTCIRGRKQKGEREGADVTVKLSVYFYFRSGHFASLPRPAAGLFTQTLMDSI